MGQNNNLNDCHRVTSDTLKCSLLRDRKVVFYFFLPADFLASFVAGVSGAGV